MLSDPLAQAISLKCPTSSQINATITVHDSCAVRFEKFIHSAQVRIMERTL